jgi:hypothetical protein
MEEGQPELGFISHSNFDAPLNQGLYYYLNYYKLLIGTGAPIYFGRSLDLAGIRGKRK